MDFPHRAKRKQFRQIFLPFGIFSGLLICAVAAPLAAQQATPEFRPVRALAAQKPITDFPVKSAREAASLLNPAELVIGVTVGEESRAYPINILTGPSREILNDTLGEQAIAATW